MGWRVEGGSGRADLSFPEERWLDDSVRGRIWLLKMERERECEEMPTSGEWRDCLPDWTYAECRVSSSSHWLDPPDLIAGYQTNTKTAAGPQMFNAWVTKWIHIMSLPLMCFLLQLLVIWLIVLDQTRVWNWNINDWIIHVTKRTTPIKLNY